MGMAIPFPLAVIVLVGINLALLLPSTPASAGPFEGATVAVLMLAGIGKTPAVAFALFYHAIQVIPVTAVGVLVLLVAKRRRSPEPARASTAQLEGRAILGNHHPCRLVHDHEPNLPGDL